MSNFIQLVVATKCSVVCASYMVTVSNPFGLWLTPDLEQLNERSALFHEQFMLEAALYYPEQRAFIVSVDDKRPNQVCSNIVFGIDDDPKGSLVDAYKNAFALVNRQDDVDAVIVPLYRGNDTELEFRARVSQLAVVLRAYRELSGERRRIRRICLLVESIAVYDQALRSLGDLVANPRTRHGAFPHNRHNSHVA